MGLDITAYGNVEYIETIEDWDEYEEKYGVEAHESVVRISDNWEGHMAQFDALVKGGVYRIDQEQVEGFRAGSYSGYNYWRAELCRMAHGAAPESIWEAPDQWKGAAFYELINFSDCEGTIGPETSAKLARDFAEYQQAVDEYQSEDGDSRWDTGFRTLYAKWRKAFELAAQGGFVRFH